jgi:hypothetical protein
VIVNKKAIYHQIIERSLDCLLMSENERWRERLRDPAKLIEMLKIFIASKNRWRAAPAARPV